MTNKTSKAKACAYDMIVSFAWFILQTTANLLFRAGLWLGCLSGLPPESPSSLQATTSRCPCVRLTMTCHNYCSRLPGPGSSPGCSLNLIQNKNRTPIQAPGGRYMTTVHLPPGALALSSSRCPTWPSGKFSIKIQASTGHSQNPDRGFASFVGAASRGAHLLLRLLYPGVQMPRCWCTWAKKTCITSTQWSANHCIPVLSGWGSCIQVFIDTFNPGIPVPIK